MEELLDMITKDDSPSNISDKIKDILFAKSAEKIDAFKPNISNSVFGETETDTEEQEEA